MAKASLDGPRIAWPDDPWWRTLDLSVFIAQALIQRRCNRCRSRKTRCAGNPPLPCAACVDVGQMCVYSEAEKRISITERSVVIRRYCPQATKTGLNPRHPATTVNFSHKLDPHEVWSTCNISNEASNSSIST